MPGIIYEAKSGIVLQSHPLLNLYQKKKLSWSQMLVGLKWGYTVARRQIRLKKNHYITRKELLAVVEAVKRLQHNIYGVETVVRTDHGALTWLLNLKHIEGQMARRLETLGTYDLNIRHRTGREHMNADSLSRLPCANCENCAKLEARDQTPQLEDTKTGPSVKVQTRTRTAICNEDPHSLTENRDDWLPTAKDKIRIAQNHDEETSLVYGWLV